MAETPEQLWIPPDRPEPGFWKGGCGKGSLEMKSGFAHKSVRKQLVLGEGVEKLEDGGVFQDQLRLTRLLCGELGAAKDSPGQAGLGTAGAR